MPKDNKGNPKCQSCNCKCSNCCPGGIKEQQPVEKQLSSIPEESSRKTRASESVKAKVEQFELKSRASHEVHEKTEQPKEPVKKPVNTVPQVKSGMDVKKVQIGDVSAKDLFKAIQFTAINQKNQRSYMSE